MPLPEPIITLLAHFQAAFTSPTWQKAVGLFVGTLLARGLRTVTIALRRIGLQETPQFSNYQHLLKWGSLVTDASGSLFALLVGRDVCAGKGSTNPVLNSLLTR